MWLAGWLATAALAQQTCIEPMSRMQLGAALGDLEASFDAKDVDGFRTRVDALGERFPCYEEPMDPELFARYARWMAVAWFFKQDEEEVKRWGLAARWADADLPWDDKRFPKSHPVRVWTQSAAMPPLGQADEEHFVVPKGGGVVLSGLMAPRPEVPAELPVLVQVFDADRELVRAFWQNGNTFPPDMVAPGPGDLAAPAWWWAPEGTELPKHHGSGDHPFPVVPVAAGSSLVAVGAVTYGLAASAAASLAHQDTAEGLTAARTRANVLVLCSAVAVAGGVGIGVGGVLLTADGITVRF